MFTRATPLRLRGLLASVTKLLEHSAEVVPRAALEASEARVRELREALGLLIARAEAWPVHPDAIEQTRAALGRPSERLVGVGLRQGEIHRGVRPRSAGPRDEHALRQARQSQWVPNW